MRAGSRMHTFTPMAIPMQPPFPSFPAPQCHAHARTCSHTHAHARAHTHTSTHAHAHAHTQGTESICGITCLVGPLVYYCHWLSMHSQGCTLRAGCFGIRTVYFADSQTHARVANGPAHYYPPVPVIGKLELLPWTSVGTTGSCVYQ